MKKTLLILIISITLTNSIYADYFFIGNELNITTNTKFDNTTKIKKISNFDIIGLDLSENFKPFIQIGLMNLEFSTPTIILEYTYNLAYGAGICGDNLLNDYFENVGFKYNLGFYNCNYDDINGNYKMEEKTFYGKFKCFYNYEYFNRNIYNKVIRIKSFFGINYLNSKIADNIKNKNCIGINAGFNFDFWQGIKINLEQTFISENKTTLGLYYDF